MNGTCASPHLEARVANTRHGNAGALLRELWQVAKQYAKEAGLRDSSLEYRAGAIVVRDAPFVGTVPICAITDNQVVPYF